MYFNIMLNFLNFLNYSLFKIKDKRFSPQTQNSLNFGNENRNCHAKLRKSAFLNLTEV